ncbi:uncharacterized protein LOC134261747 [Saccostrea cucullata]|uniref:uncharacterized protein LOC134261747 n=1 Tax=Saccostrea cuccullata TaxID=36930 RepID=UPI002ED0E4CD
MKGEYQLLKDKQVQEAEDMVDDRIAASKYFDLNDTRQTAILILLAHLKIVLGTRLCKNICQPLYLLAHNPATLKKTFLPTMPDVNLEGNMLTYTPKMIQGKSYVCPNNHIYFIGDVSNRL